MQKLLKAYHDMLLIRRFEQTVEKLFSEGRIVGTAHTCIGQEAIAVGIAAALQPHDALTSTHRGHGHFIARGGDPSRIMSELFGRKSGYSHGRGGSQMMMAPELGFYGTNGITGASVAFAAGLALNAKMTGANRIVASFFGDGASNQGIIAEVLNIAALWKLPLIAICETNGYAMSTPTETGVSTGSVAKRAEGYGIPGLSIDGNDFESVRDTFAGLAARARAGEGPSLLECRTYRLSGHSRGDQRVYRTREEENEAWKHEPIEHIADKIRKMRVSELASLRVSELASLRVSELASLPVSELVGGDIKHQTSNVSTSTLNSQPSTLDAIAAEVEKEIEKAVAFATADTVDDSGIFSGVYA